MSIVYMDPKKWVAVWKNAGREMDRLRKQELRKQNSEETILSLLPAFEDAIVKNEPRPSSGMIEQQRYFKRWREKQRG